ncbi:MAG TPA: ABC-2 family transporter protein [Anaerolineae bacterium]|nr:ABC-2 family transporter protein [Anaerolineae bacterium]
MRLYIELAKKSFQRQVAYRTATLAGLITNMFFGVLRASILIAVYNAQTSSVPNYSVRDAITYTGMTQAFIGAMALWGWYEMINSIKSGEVASDLARPYDYYNFWLAQDLGRSLFQLFTRGVLGMLIFIVFFGASMPSSVGQWSLFAMSTLLALLLSFSWRFLASSIGFWTTDAVGWMRIASLGILLPTGFMIPLAFMPIWLQTLCYLTPFPGMMNTPVDIYLGRATGDRAAILIGLQIFWLIVLMAVGRLAAYAGRRKLTIQGG